MIQKDDVINHLKTLFTLSDDEIQKQMPLIDSQLLSLQNNGMNTEDVRASVYAALSINYSMALLRSSGDSVTSFKAGDISITENNGDVESAKKLLDGFISSNADLLGDTDFVFRTV